MAIPVLSGVTDALEWYQNNVGDPFAGYALKGLNKAKLGLGFNDEGALAINQADPHQALDIAFKDRPLERFLYTSAADPLNFVGVGIPEKLAATGLRGVPLLGKALHAADVADKLPGRAIGGAIDTAVDKGIRPGFDALYRGALAPAGHALEGKAPGLVDAYQKALRAWREQALVSGSYHATNAASNISQALIHGDPRTAVQTIQGMLRGKNVGDEVAHTLGRAMPTEIVSNPLHAPTGGGSSGSVFHELSGTPVHGPTLGGGRLRNIDQNPVLEKIGDLSEANGRFGSHLEAAARKAAWGNKTREVIQRWAKSEAELLERSGAPNAADFIRSSGGMFQAGSIMPALRADGIRGRTATTLINRIGAKQSNAIQEGVDYANKLFFDYSQHNPVDKVGQNLFAFHRFAVNNIPQSLRKSAETPAVLNIPTNYYQESDRYNDQHGLTSKMHGEMPLPFQVGGNSINVNPLKWTPFGSIVGAATRPEREQGETWLGELANTGRDIGLGLNPFLELPLQVTGQFGRNIPNGLLRAAQPVNAVASLATGAPQDIEGPYKDLVGGITKEVSGVSQFPYRDYLLRKKLAELGGSADASLATQGPLVDEANQQLAHEQGVSGLVGFSGLAPGFKTVSPEEQIVRHNAAETNQLVQQYGTRASALNPTRGIYGNTDPMQVAIDNFENLPPDQQEALLDDPVARDMVIEHIAQKLHGSKYRHHTYQ